MLGAPYFGKLPNLPFSSVKVVEGELEGDRAKFVECAGTARGLGASAPQQFPTHRILVSFENSTFFGGPYSKDYSIWGMGFPYFGKLLHIHCNPF